MPMGKNGNLDLSLKNGAISFISLTMSAKNAAISSKKGRSRSSAKRGISGRSLQPPATKVCCARKCMFAVVAAPASKRTKKPVIRCRFFSILISTNIFTNSICGFAICTRKALSGLAVWPADSEHMSIKKGLSCSTGLVQEWQKKF